MPLPTEGQLSASQVAEEFGVSQTDISFQNLGTLTTEPITEGDPVNLPDDFYGAAGSVPTVVTNAVTNVAATSMTLNGNITMAAHANFQLIINSKKQKLNIFIGSTIKF